MKLNISYLNLGTTFEEIDNGTPFFNKDGILFIKVSQSQEYKQGQAICISGCDDDTKNGTNFPLTSFYCGEAVTIARIDEIKATEILI